MEEQKNYNKIFPTFSYSEFDPKDYDMLFCMLLETWNPSRKPLAAHLINCYRIKYSEEFKIYLCNFLGGILNDDSLFYSTSGHKTKAEVIVNAVNNEFSHHYDDKIECITKISNHILDVFPAMIYYMSAESARFGMRDGHYPSANCLNNIIRIPSVYNLFKQRFIWGLENINAPELKTTDVHYAFNYKTNIPCFLDGFLDTFFFERGTKFDIIGCCNVKNDEELNLEFKKLEPHLKNFKSCIHAILIFLIKDPEIKQNFLDYLVLVIDNNKDRLKIEFDVSKVISDGFAFNLNYILSEFSANIVDRDLLKLIDIYALFNLNFFEDEKINLLNVETEKILEIKNEEKKSFTTVIFHAKISMMKHSFLKFLELAVEYSKQIEHFSPNIMHDPRYVSAINGIKSRKNAYLILLSTESFKNESDFIIFMTKFALETKPEKYKMIRNSMDSENKLAEIINYKSFPESYFSAIFTLSKNRKFKKNENFIVILLTKILNDPEMKVHIKTDSIETLLNLKSAEYLSKSLFEGLKEYYEELEKSTLMYKYQPRGSVIKLMINDKNGNVENLAKENKNDLKFVNLFLSNLENILNEGLGSIKKIKERSSDEYLNKLSEEEKEENLKSIKRYSTIARGAFSCLKNELLLLKKINMSNDILCDKNLIETFISILNNNLKTLVGPRVREIVVKDKEKYDFDPKEMLALLMQNYILINKKSVNGVDFSQRRESFVRKIAEDSVYFKLEYFMEGINVCEMRGILFDDKIKLLRILYKDLENKIEEIRKENENIVEKEVPHNLIDPLMGIVMENPVKLLTSGITVDKTTFDALMMSTMIDPFNRMKLSEDSAIIDNEISKIYEDWKNN